MFKLQYHYLNRICTNVLLCSETLNNKYILWKKQNPNYQCYDDYNCVAHPARAMIEKSMDPRYYHENQVFLNAVLKEEFNKTDAGIFDFQQLFEYIYHVFYFYHKSEILCNEAAKSQTDFWNSNRYVLAESKVHRFCIDWNRKTLVLELQDVQSLGERYADADKKVDFINLNMVFKNIANLKMKGGFFLSQPSRIGMVLLENGAERKYSWSMYWGDIPDVTALELECDEILFH